MRYFAYITPPDNVTRELSRIKEKYSFKTPGSGFHITLWGFNLREETQGELLRRIRKIKFEPIKYEFYYLDIFENNSLAIVAEDINGDIRHLHDQIILITRAFDKNHDKFDEMHRRIGGDNYTPHLTIAKNFHGIINIEELYGVLFNEYEASRFHLSKKKKWFLEQSFLIISSCRESRKGLRRRAM